MRPLAFIENPLDRCANQRGDAAWLAELRRSARARIIHIAGDKTRVAEGHVAGGQEEVPGETVFLGIDPQGVPWFAGRAEAGEGFQDLRSIALEQRVPDHELGILAQARSLINWHERRTFCSNCGARNEMADAGYRRHCPNCKTDHFPRTDPVIIIVARSRGRILLGRQSSWQPGMYSALAGFMEPGETIEQAARREVYEESGIRLGAINYVTSQPWPFPSNLMIGLIGEADSDEISIDAKELEDARWFPEAEARLMLDRKHPDGLWATNPMAIAHLLVRTALQPT
jgi:NAD+ diphosphatase